MVEAMEAMGGSNIGIFISKLDGHGECFCEFSGYRIVGDR